MIAALLQLCTIIAAEELVTDRPDQTEAAVTVAPGKVQMETGITYTQDEHAHSLSLPETLVRIGLTTRLELRLGWEGVEHALQDHHSIARDGELGLKVRLWDEKEWRPEAAILAGVSLPFGSTDSTSNRLDPSFRLSFAHTLSERWSLGYNIGAEWTTEGDEEDTAHTLAAGIYTLAFGYGATERLGLFVEFFGEVPINGQGGPAHSFDGGMTVLLRDNVQWDMSAGTGLNNEAPDWFASTGISVRFGDE